MFKILLSVFMSQTCQVDSTVLHLNSAVKMCDGAWCKVFFLFMTNHKGVTMIFQGTECGSLCKELASLCSHLKQVSLIVLTFDRFIMI